MDLLRLTRATQYLPRFTGINLLQSAWGHFLDPSALFRIPNFDGDLKLDVNMGETMGVNLWHIPQLVERHERKLFCDAITPGCTVLDVGANIGIYTLLAAKRSAVVFSIEADPHNAARLRHHLELNSLNASVYEIASVSSPGTVTLHRNPRNSGGSTLSLAFGPGDVAARGQTIDSLNLPPVDICKIDIEGSEMSALNGMRDTMRRSPRMKLLIEYGSLSDGTVLLASLRSHFTHIAVAGRSELNGSQPPINCNLWCWN